ncbi:unnamed protein product, partial [Pleuronectes platessa]
LRSNPSHLRELDLRGNDLKDSEVKELLDLQQSSTCRLETLSVSAPNRSLELGSRVIMLAVWPVTSRPDRSVKKEEEMFLYLECGHFISRIYCRSNTRITSSPPPSYPTPFHPSHPSPSHPPPSHGALGWKLATAPVATLAATDGRRPRQLQPATAAATAGNRGSYGRQPWQLLAAGGRS